MSDQTSPAGKFTPSDWAWAAKKVKELYAKIHETEALRIFFKKVTYSARSGAHGMPASGVWLFGDAGSGKTTALTECRRLLSEDTDLDSATPSILLTLLPSPTMHTIVRGLLAQLKYPFANARTFGERAELLFDVLRKKQVRVVFVDEIQHVIEGNRTANRVEIRDFFKRLIDETNVCLVFSGLPSARKLREQDQQLASRVPGEVLLTTNFSKPEGREFISALLQLGPIPFADSASEKIQDVFSLREVASARLVSQVIAEATKIAALMRSPAVLDAHVLHAFRLTLLGGTK
jgi:hypothetical protein